MHIKDTEVSLVDEMTMHIQGKEVTLVDKITMQQRYLGNTDGWGDNTRQR